MPLIIILYIIASILSYYNARRNFKQHHVNLGYAWLILSVIQLIATIAFLTGFLPIIFK